MYGVDNLTRWETHMDIWLNSKKMPRIWEIKDSFAKIHLHDVDISTTSKTHIDIGLNQQKTAISRDLKQF